MRYTDNAIAFVEDNAKQPEDITGHWKAVSHKQFRKVDMSVWRVPDDFQLISTTNSGKGYYRGDLSSKLY